MPEHNSTKHHPARPADETAPASKTRKPYTKPDLVPCGDVRDVTMGGSPGVGDSGNGALEKPFGT